MRLYYIDESEGPRYYVRSALGVDAERWNDLFRDIHAWRIELRDRYRIPTDRELHACDLLAGRGMLARNGRASERLTPRQGARSSWPGCVASRTRHRASAAWRSSTSASTSRTESGTSR